MRRYRGVTCAIVRWRSGRVIGSNVAKVADVVEADEAGWAVHVVEDSRETAVVLREGQPAPVLGAEGVGDESADDEVVGHEDFVRSWLVVPSA
jgi:hypothetical protein